MNTYFDKNLSILILSLILFPQWKIKFLFRILE